jgi:hypothetical protein
MNYHSTQLTVKRDAPGPALYALFQTYGLR